MKRYSRQAGMTLLELLIATMVLSIMAGMGFVGINALMEASVGIGKQERHLQKENAQLIMISQDVAAAISSKQFIQTNQTSDFTGDALRFELTRFEQSLLPATGTEEVALGDVIQVAWYVRNGTLFRSQRPVVQRNNSQAWVSQAMTEVKSWYCEYLSLSGQWQPNWPLQSADNGQLPRQVKCRVTALDGRDSDWLLTPWQET